MIFPEKMSRVQIIANKELLDDIVTKILKFQNFEPEDPEEPISNERFEGARRKLGTIQEHLNKLQIIMDLAGIVIEPKGKMKAGNWSRVAEEVEAEAVQEEEKYKELLEEIGKIRGELDLYKAQLNELLPFKDITVSLNKLYNLKLFDIYLFTISPSQLDKVKIDNAVVLTKRVNEKTYAVVVIAPKGVLQKDKLEKEIGVKVFETPEGKAPYDVYNEVQNKVNELTKILEETRAKLKEKLRSSEPRLKEIYGKLLTVRDALNIISKARVSEFYVQIEGYAPTKMVKKLKDQLKGIAFVTERLPRWYEEKDKPPTLISLPKSIRVIESVVELYGTPSYWEISPIVFLVFTFPIIFGLMFPDFGNALVIFLFAVWFYKYGKRKGSENIQKLSLVLIYSSIVAMITGLLAREFFGPVLVGGPREVFNNEAYPVGPLYYVWPVPVSVSDSLKYLLPFGHYDILATQIKDTMIISMFIGALALFVSSLIGVINAIDKRDPEFLFYEKLPLLILYTVPLIIFGYGFVDVNNYFAKVECLLGALLTNIFSFPPNLSTPTYVLAYILVLWVEIGLIYNWVSKIILIKRHEGHVSLGTAIGMGFIEGAFEAGVLLLSNTISFIRILVFALAHYYLLYAFSYMGLLVIYSSIPYAVAVVLAGIVIAIGNLLAIALEGLVAFIQDTRLHFYEMFSKFYEGKGRKFMPAMNYVELVEEEKEVAKQVIEVKAV